MKLDLDLDAVKDLVKDFALDVWEDLSRTRLAGVAVGLTIALVAITAIMVRPGGEAEVAASTAVISAPPPADDISFSVPSDEPLTMSDIDQSSSRDPFRSLGGVAASDQTLLAAGEEIIDSVMGLGSTGGSTTTAATADDTTSLMPLDDLTPDGTTTPPADTGEPQGDFGDTAEPQDADEVPATDYAYTADVQFGQIGDLHRYATVQRLGLIPSRQMPLIMFLGVSTDHQTAVFMVDSRLSQGGEGTCVPKESLCTFLELQATPAHDEHHFKDADGNEYLLRLRGLTRTSESTGSLTGRDVSELKGTPPVVDGER